METVDFGTTPAERLERLRGKLRGTPVVGTRAAQRTQPSRGSHLLLGVMLHAAARLEAGLELTDLETRMLAPLRLLLSEEEVRDFGRVYREENTARSTAAVFPEVLTGRAVEQGYAVADLVKDLPALREEILAQANVNLVDLDAPAAGEETWDSAQFIEGQAAYGYGATFVTASKTTVPPAEEPGVNASFIARVDMHSFYCEDESNEASASDEIYWATSSVGAFGARTELLTPVRTNVDKGEWHDFAANTTVFYGRVNTSLVCNISCWEEDDGGDKWRNELRDKLRAISAELMKFLEVMEIYGYLAPQYGDFLDYVQITAIVALIVAWLIDLFRNNDDLIQERTLVFSQAALRQLVTSGGANSTGWVFNGGDAEGRHRLQLKWIGSPPPADNPGDVMVITRANGRWSAPVRLRDVTDAGPSMVVHNGDLHVASRGMNGGVHIGKFSGGVWGGYGFVPGLTTWTPPALAVNAGTLYVTSGGPQGQIYVSANSFDWGRPVQLSGASSAGAALASRGGQLHCAIRGKDDNGQVYLAWLRGTTWSAFHPVPGLTTPHAPALAAHAGNLYVAAVGMDGKTYVSVDNGTAWSTTPMDLGGLTDCAPALTVRNGVLYCAVRALQGEVVLNNLNGTTWTGFHTPVPGAATMSEAALAGDTGDTLHIAYRSM
ncbi:MULTISPECIES: hypothetical protein [Streptomycetaceae]|uniref:Uncharacterized protein n=2 Tax=Kitasatospora phosalacinea TaxID=2065 RepID=A0A9W6UNN4_9ACTN|nr:MULTISPECIES: hypothetical protein [Streptomycetaceae]OKI49404.1 hypothetical protein AMK17_37725 [Streptomyces sp. CB00072]GLW53715.1 hypothetical protein Kpho01_17260 [Kitasatospora phosalacinea]